MQSKILFQKALQVIPGGVNSPVRAFQGVGGEPLFIKSAKGAYLFDADGKAYVDYVGSWGAMIVGHAHPQVIEAVRKAIEKGLSYGAPTEAEVLLAEKICRLVPGIEKIRFTTSGTEATMTAIRLARGITGRSKIIKFAGCYHGHSDGLLVKSGSGGLTFGIPSSAGVSSAVVSETLVANFNDVESVKKLFDQHGAEIAAIIFEPIAANMNVVLPGPGFLQTLQNLCEAHGSLLICDEVITGFRVALQGAQALYAVQPDLTTFGKIIGGGLPVGAVGGKAKWMDYLAPQGPVYQAGTLAGNPVAMAAGLANLELLEQSQPYEKLRAQTQSLVNELQLAARDIGIPLHINHTCGLFGLFFTEKKAINNLDDVMQCDAELFKVFFHAMLEEGVYLAPSAFEAGFLTLAHGSQEIDFTVNAAKKALKKLRQLRVAKKDYI